MDFYAIIFLLMLIAPIVYMYSVLNKSNAVTKQHFRNTFIMAVVGMAFFPIIFFTAIKNSYHHSLFSVIGGAVTAGLIWGIICCLFLWLLKKWLKK